MSDDHDLPIPGGSLYYRTQGAGPPLVLIGGGPSNADTLSALAARLDDEYTVVSYDRRGYSRSQLADPAAPATIGQHAGDVRRIIADLGPGPAAVFGSSIGAVIALELAAAAPAEVARLVVHEPPLGQLLTRADRAAFDLDDGPGPGPDAQRDAEAGAGAGATLNAMAAAIGVRRGAQAGAGGPGGAGVPGWSGDKARAADIELFVQRDMPAVGRYHLDLDRLAPLTGRLVVAGGRESRDFYPYRCAERLAAVLDRPLAELPGHHAGMIQHPAEFAAALKVLLHQAPLPGGR